MSPHGLLTHTVVCAGGPGLPPSRCATERVACADLGWRCIHGRISSPGRRHRPSPRRRAASSPPDLAVRRTRDETPRLARAPEVGPRRTVPDDLFTKLVGDAPEALATRPHDRPRAAPLFLATRRSGHHRQAPSCRRPQTSASRRHRSTHRPAITTSILRLASTLSRLSASLRPPSGAHGLDRLSIEPREGIYVMAGRA